MDSDKPEPRGIIPDLPSKDESAGSEETPHFDTSKRQMISRSSVPAGLNIGAYKHPIEPLKAPTASDINPPTTKAQSIPIAKNMPDEAKVPVDKEPEEEPVAEEKPSSSLSEKVYQDIGGKSAPQANKLTEASKKDANQEKQIEEYIKDRQFFVPIKSVAQKKSVKVSVGLTILIIFLSLLLIDLMLDSGAILFVQKLPHTHFFSNNDR